MAKQVAPKNANTMEVKSPVNEDVSMIDQMDAEKLHEEALQLRSQQFYLSTVALAGSGLASWLGPGLASITKDAIQFYPLMIATSCWLILLVFLYSWTLVLRRLIHVIGWYLEENGLSNWEGRFRKFSARHQFNLFTWKKDWWNRYIRSQNNYYRWAFVFYGIVAWAGSLSAGESGIWPFDSKEQWTTEQYAPLLKLCALLVGYFVAIFLVGNCHCAYDDQVQDDWKQFFEDRK